LGGRLSFALRGKTRRANASDLQIVPVPIDELQADPANLRKISAEELDRLTRSLRESAPASRRAQVGEAAPGWGLLLLYSFAARYLRCHTGGSHTLLEVPHRPVGAAVDLECIEELRSMRWREAEILEVDPERRNHYVFDSLVARADPLAMALRLSWRANRLPLGKGRADPEQCEECS
jgi:hypothetical protein